MLCAICVINRRIRWESREQLQSVKTVCAVLSRYSPGSARSSKLFRLKTQFTCWHKWKQNLYMWILLLCFVYFFPKQKKLILKSFHKILWLFTCYHSTALPSFYSRLRKISSSVKFFPTRTTKSIFFISLSFFFLVL